MTGSFGRRQKGSGALSISGPHNFIPDLLSPWAVIEAKSATLAPPTVRSAPNHCGSLYFNGGLGSLHFEYWDRVDDSDCIYQQPSDRFGS